MLCVFPTYKGDIDLLVSLLLWTKEIGGCKNHSALIVADAGISWDDCQNLVSIAGQSFSEVKLTVNESSVSGWINGSNSLWKTTAIYCKEKKIDGWLWMETDCVPLKSGWLDLIDVEYKEKKIPFLGCVYSCSQEGLPKELISGIAVYPMDAIDYFKDESNVAFDVQLSRHEHFKTLMGHTNLIQHFWGEMDLPPTFQIQKVSGSPKNVFTMQNLKPEAVIFHRVKDGSLIRILRQRTSVEPENPLLIVLPVCNKDAHMMLKSIEWMLELHGKTKFDCLISYDTSIGKFWKDRVISVAGMVFKTVYEMSYPRPMKEVWPDACNIAFQSAARHIQIFHKRPWLWFEADCVALKSNWMDIFQSRYLSCGKPVMGAVVKGMWHLNGTAVYPKNFWSLSPSAMNTVDTAWDTVMMNDLHDKYTDASDILCHRWGMVNGELSHTEGDAPHFAHASLVESLIPKTAAMFHRCKDGSLVDRLREMKRKK